MQQLNVWRPLKGPVTCQTLAVCDGTTVAAKSKSIHMGLFGTGVVIHHDGQYSLSLPVVNSVGLFNRRADAQKWWYIKRQEANEAFILKIYDSKVLPGQADFAPHTGVDELNGADGPEAPRESIEVRLVACYS